MLRERLAELECRLALVESSGRSLAAGLELPKLSTTERRVAELLVAGLDNDEIARRLFLTARAVDWSVTRISRKLGAGSRAELAASHFKGRVAPTGKRPQEEGT